MARAIDKQTMLNLIIEAKMMDPETGSFSEWLAEYLVEHLPTLTPPNEWVSVEERLPEDRQIVLFHQKDGFIYCAEHLAGVKDLPPAWLIDNDSWEGENITHWMALPAPPDSCQPEGEEDNND